MQATRQMDTPLYHDSPDAFIAKYGEEFSQVPPYMRQRVAYLIDQKVEMQVKDQMDEFKTEVWAELKDQRETSENTIQNYHGEADKHHHEIQRKQYEDVKIQHLKV